MTGGQPKDSSPLESPETLALLETDFKTDLWLRGLLNKNQKTYGMTPTLLILFGTL